jgi:hypothetical protein
VKLPRRLPRPEILIVAGAALLAFVITLAVLAAQAGARARGTAAAARQEMQRTAKKPLLSAEELEITPEDYMIPNLAPAPLTQQYVPYRPRLPRWNPELVQKYWVDPKEIAKEIVGSINDRAMEQLFQNVP